MIQPIIPITELETTEKSSVDRHVEDLDDVQEVYHNAEIPDEIMEQLIECWRVERSRRRHQLIGLRASGLCWFARC